MFYFHKVAYVHYLGKVEIFSYMSKQIYSSLQQCKNYKNRSRFTKVMITNVLPPFFMVHSVSRILVCRGFSLLAYTRVTNFLHIFSHENGGQLICGTFYTLVYMVFAP